MEESVQATLSNEELVVYYNAGSELLSYQLRDALYVADPVGPHLALLWAPNGHELIGCQILSLPALLRTSGEITRHAAEKQPLFLRTLIGYARNARGKTSPSDWKYVAAQEFVLRAKVPYEEWSKALPA